MSDHDAAAVLRPDDDGWRAPAYPGLALCQAQHQPILYPWHTFACTLPHDHDDDHAAHGVNSDIVAIWSNR